MGGTNEGQLFLRYYLRDIEPLELIISEREAAVGPKQFTAPHCLTCLAPVQVLYGTGDDPCSGFIFGRSPEKGQHEVKDFFVSVLSSVELLFHLSNPSGALELTIFLAFGFDFAGSLTTLISIISENLNTLETLNVYVVIEFLLEF